MSDKVTNDPSALESIESVFHQPRRLDIMSELCGAAGGLSFSELKGRCGLTDGNLNRHLQALQKAGAIKVKKSFIGVKPNTSVSVTAKGRQRFLDYLGSLEAVLKAAAQKVSGKADSESSSSVSARGLQKA
jgi:DNA-binding HxlR family transcriptional regulator